MKFLITLTALSFSLSSFAQMSESEKRRVENKLEGTLPEARALENNSERKIHMGLEFGMANPNGAIGSSPEYGISVGYQPYIPFGVGAELLTSELDDINIQRTSLLAKGTYNFGGEVPVLRSSYVGVVTGPMFIEDGDTEWSVGPTVGFDIPLENKPSQYLSLGLSTKYLWTTSTVDTFSAGLNLKYWY